MSIKLASGTPDYLEGTEPGVTYPFAISLWFSPSAMNLDMVLASIADASVEDNFHSILFKGTLGTNRVHAVSDDAEAISTLGLTGLGTWDHILAVWASASDRKIYLNGANEGTDATAKTIAGLDTLTIGRLGKLTPTNPTSGRVAELAIWNLSTVLTATERTQLGSVGVSALLIRAAELISYTPMPGAGTDPVVDTIGGFHLTQFGSPVDGEDDPPVLAPQQGQPEPPAISAINASVAHSIAFGQTADNNIEQGVATNAVAFGQVAGNNIIQASVTSTVLFGQAPVNNIKQGDATHTVTFGQTVTHNVTFHSVSNDLLFGQLAPETNIAFIQLNSDIQWGSFGGREIELSLTSDLAFTHDTFSNFKLLSVSNSFTLTPAPLSSGSEYCRSIIQQFLFGQDANRTIEDTAASAILFGQEAARAATAASQLFFDGVVTAEQCKAALNQILFDQIVAVSHDRVLALGNSCTWINTVVGIVDSNCALYGYNPNGPLPAIVLGVRSGIRLEQGAFNIELRNPEFANADDVDPKRVFRRSRGGTVQLTRDPIWPKKTTIEMGFSALTRVEAQALLTFLTDTLGQLVTLTDQEDQTWDGVILNPDAGISDFQGDQDCNYGANLTFIGDRT